MRQLRRLPVIVAAGLAVVAAIPTGAAARPAAGPRPQFDLEGHRGARGLRPENTLPGFATALEIGVTTLELDTGITEDGVVVVSHDRHVPALCRDTGPAFSGDPEFPYVGDLIVELTLAQIKTLDCGSTPNPNFPGQTLAPGAQMPTLAEVFELVDRYGARHVQFNIETKIDPTRPDETVDPETFVEKVTAVIDAYGMTQRSMLQSFDWRTLVEARQQMPQLRLVALAQRSTIYPGSPWTAGLDIADFDGDLARMVKSLHAKVLSPNWQYMTDDMVRSAHRQGMQVVPWTVNQPADMRALIQRGVDGIITDYPERLRAVMAEMGMKLPRAYAPRAA